MSRSPIRRAALLRLATLCVPVALLALTGCNESNSPGRQFALIVEVDGEGAPEVTQIQIRGGSFGEGQAFLFPRLPFARLLSASGGETVEVEIDGRALDGRVSVRLRDDPITVEVPTVYATGSCGPNVPVCNFVVRNQF